MFGSRLLATVRQRAEALAQAHADVVAWSRRREEEIEAEYQAARRGAEHALQDAEARAAQERTAADAALAHALDRARVERDDRLASAAAEYERCLHEVQERLTEVASSGPAAEPWDSSSWGKFSPAGEPPAFVRIGTARFDGKFATIQSPVLLPFVGGRNLVIRATGAARRAAVQGVQSLMLRMLAQVPPSRLQFLLIDPVGFGDNVGAFMHLADDVPDLVTKKAWVERADIDRQLADLSAYMEMVIQGSLRGRFSDIEAFNREAKELARGYRVLVAFDFPVNFSEESARRLLSIAQNGPRCGVYTVVTVDPAQPLPRGFSLEELERTASVFTASGDNFAWNDPDFAGAVVCFDTPPESERFEQLVKSLATAAKGVGPVQVQFDQVVPLAPLWDGNSTNGVAVPVGRTDVQAVREFALGHDTAQHALVAGRTGSGKTNLFNVFIAALATRYSPEEVELYLVDFKKGLGFKEFATHALPHAKVIAIESEREFGMSVLRHLDQELRRRGELFRGAGGGGLVPYRRAHPGTAHGVPRIVLLVDEFQEFFTPPDDPIASEAKLILDRLTRQGREFGIHAVLGSQTLAGAYTLARSTMDQMAVRVALQCSEADSQLILGKDNLAAHRLARAGDAIYNEMNGLKEGNRNFQVAFLNDGELNTRLSLIRRHADAAGYAALRPLVFEGNAPATLAERADHPLLREMAREGRPSRLGRLSAWLGEPIAIGEPTTATFFRRGGRNLLLMGREEDQAIGMLTMSILSLAAQHAPEDATFLVCDLTLTALERPSFAVPLRDALPHEVRLLSARDLVTILGELGPAVTERQERGGRAPSTYLIVAGLQRARAVRADGTGYRRPDTPPGAAYHLGTILRDGPEVGVHTIAWADTPASLQSVVDRRLLGEFGMRVALPMSEKDSKEWIDSTAAARLRAYRALLSDEEQPGGLQTFRPYDVPDPSWIQTVGDILRQRALQEADAE